MVTVAKNDNKQDSVFINKRRIIFGALCSILLLFIPSMTYASSIIDIRLWPANEYTRITIEVDSYVEVKNFLLCNPNRLVVDLYNLKISTKLNKISSLIQHNNPHIFKVHFYKYKRDIVRVVFHLKKIIEPQVFILKPIDKYNYRIVLDLYSQSINDDLMNLIGQQDKYLYDPIDDLISSINNINPVKKHKITTIAIDPGHGGEDPGAIGKKGLYEKDVVLDISRKLHTLINKSPNMCSYLTRDGDYFVPLGVRIRKARKIQADLLISIHTNSWIKSDPRGASVFVLSNNGASSTQAKWIATKENSSDLVGGINLKNKDKNLARILLDLSTTAQINNSIKLGNLLLNEFKKINYLYKNNVEQAEFAILKTPDIPSVLIEVAFISNPLEEQLLRTNSYQDKIAKSILFSIKKYLDTCIR